MIYALYIINTHIHIYIYIYIYLSIYLYIYIYIYTYVQGRPPPASGNIGSLELLLVLLALRGRLLPKAGRRMWSSRRRSRRP